MKKAVWVVVPALLAVTLSGCGVQPSNQTVGESVPVVAPAAGVRPANTVTFFEGTSSPAVEIALKPDPSIERSFPNAKPPSKMVQVYLPVYPGAVTTAPAPEIGDMGRALDADFVDGTAYFRSKDSEAKILAWYKAKLGKLGYSVGSWGSTQKFGQTTSKYFSSSMSKAGKSSGQSSIL